MSIENRISNYLNDMGHLDFTRIDEFHQQIGKALIETYTRIPAKTRVDFLREACAFALAKSMEKKLLSKIRPGQKNIPLWLVIMEIQDGCKFNLPTHLEDKIFDYMDACENAVDTYTRENLNFDLDSLIAAVEVIGDMLVDEDKLDEVTVANLSNENVMTRDEFHNFCLQGAVKSLENQGFTIEKVNLGSASPVSIVAKKDNITFNVAVPTEMLPKTGEIKGWQLRELERIETSDSTKVGIMGVSIIPEDELYASMGVAIKEGNYSFKVSELHELKPRGNREN